MTDSVSDILSPTLSGSSHSSFIRVPDSEYSDDEIVYSIDGSLSDERVTSDDDFVLLSAPSEDSAAVHSERLFDELDADNLSVLADNLHSLTIRDSPIQPTVTEIGRVASNASVLDPDAFPSSSIPSTPRTKPITTGKTVTTTKATTKSTTRLRRKNKKGSVSPPPASNVSNPTTLETTPEYEEAVNYITRFISDSEVKKDKDHRLALLQSMIIEFGLTSSASLPASLNSARALLKARVFINIREYLDVREQGFEALRAIMHPSKSALVRSIKKTKNVAPRGQVKEAGLQVLMVRAYR